MKKQYEIWLESYATGETQSNIVHLTDEELACVKQALETARLGDEPIVACFTALPVSEEVGFDDLKDALEGFLDKDIFA